MTEEQRASTGEPVSIPRRTIVKGAAWSVPVIAAAVAAPAASASTTPCNSPANIGISYMALQGSGVTQNGLPVYGANSTPFVDLNIVNTGACSAAVGSVLVQIAQPNRLIPGYAGAIPTGWTLAGTGNDGASAYIRLVNTSEIASGASLSLRQFLKVSSAPPAGRTLGTVTASVNVPGNVNAATSGTRQFYTQG